MLKLDLAKAFDWIEWNFIEAAQTSGVPPSSYHTCTNSCIAMPYYLVLVNDDLAQPFHPQRGIRHGCPLLPYLFVIAINDVNHVQGVNLGPGCPLIHSLLFADDLIICGHASVAKTTTINVIIQDLCSASSQTPNLNKSSIQR
jgi:hypothetical protein